MQLCMRIMRWRRGQSSCNFTAAPAAGKSSAAAPSHTCSRAPSCASLHAVVTDQTGFYPTGGGQPGDSGCLLRADGTSVKFAARAAPAALPRLGAPEHALAEAAQRLRQWQQRLQGRGLRLEKLTVTPRLSWSAVVRAGGADAGGAVQLLFGREQVERRLARFIGGYENGLRAVFLAFAPTGLGQEKKCCWTVWGIRFCRLAICCARGWRMAH